MTTFKHILVPTDFGEPSDRAVDVAALMAAMFESRLTLLHASWLPPSAYAAYAEGLYWPAEEVAKESQKALDAAVARAQKAYPKTESAVVKGEPWQAILDAAQERGCDLIVMGTHGRRGLSRMLIGSVAEKVVRLSPVPVLTVCGKAEQDAKANAIARAPSSKS